MATLPCTTTAGRHAAQLRRERDREELTAERLAALDTLTRALQSRPLQTVSDLRPRAEALPQIACKLRLDYCGLDRVWIDATLRDLDWRPARDVMSRFNGKYEFRVLEHVHTGARLALTITLPEGVAQHWEAA